MNRIKLQSPAKVNLSLHIVGRRPNGYHEIVSVFHRLSLADTLTLEKKETGFLFSSNANLPVREGNLLFKAYLELKNKFPNLGGVRAKLMKRIPIGAGLGGGSSNAAFFMRGIKRLYGLKISESEMLQLGLRVGADVPFFLKNKKQMFVRGIGEKLKDFPSRKKRWFLLITDPRPLPTVLVYRKYRQSNCCFSQNKVQKEMFVNDLQASAIALRPSIARKMKSLTQAGAKTVLMSGSGPTVFAVSFSQNELKKLQHALPKKLRSLSILCRTA